MAQFSKIDRLAAQVERHLEVKGFRYDETPGYLKEVAGSGSTYFSVYIDDDTEVEVRISDHGHGGYDVPDFDIAVRNFITLDIGVRRQPPTRIWKTALNELLESS